MSYFGINDLNECGQLLVYQRPISSGSEISTFLSKHNFDGFPYILRKSDGRHFIIKAPNNFHWTVGSMGIGVSTHFDFFLGFNIFSEQYVRKEAYEKTKTRKDKKNVKKSKFAKFI